MANSDDQHRLNSKQRREIYQIGQKFHFNLARTQPLSTFQREGTSCGRFGLLTRAMLTNKVVRFTRRRDGNGQDDRQDVREDDRVWDEQKTDPLGQFFVSFRLSELSLSARTDEKVNKVLIFL